MGIYRASMTKRQKMNARLRVLRELKAIIFLFDEETKEMIRDLPDEIAGALLQQPFLQEEGMNLFQCYNLYQRLVDYIILHKVPKMDPLRLWASRKYWADVIYTTYITSDYADGIEALFLKDVIFRGKDHERYRKKFNRHRREAEKVSDLTKYIYFINCFRIWRTLREE